MFFLSRFFGTVKKHPVFLYIIVTHHPVPFNSWWHHHQLSGLSNNKWWKYWQLMIGDDNWWQRSTSNLDPLWATILADEALTCWAILHWAMFWSKLSSKIEIFSSCRIFSCKLKISCKLLAPILAGRSNSIFWFPLFGGRMHIVFFRQKILHVNIWDRWCDVGCWPLKKGFSRTRS